MKAKKPIVKLFSLLLAFSMLAGCSSEVQNAPETAEATTTAVTTEQPKETAAETTTVTSAETTVSETKTATETEQSEATTTTAAKTTAVTTTTAAATTEATTTTKPAATTTTAAKPANPELSSSDAMRNITTAELVADMGIGINLGNTFESCGSWINGTSVTSYETAWGSPKVTEKIIQGYSDAGFGVLRIPVAWSNLMAEDYTIDAGYIKRVKEVVKWAVDDGMYVIMNIHYDGGWWENFPTDKDNCMKKYKSIWTQLSKEFKEFSDYLMFESLNEEGCWDSVWNRYGGKNDNTAKAYSLLNEINQAFVDVVRASGGNNAKRHLLIAGYSTDIELTCDPLFEMPDDPENRCAVSVHYYTPSTFCILEKDASWGKAKATWGTAKDIKELEGYMEKVKKTFVDKGIPVIIGEYGVAQGNKTAEQVNNFVLTVCKTALSNGFCPVLWDVTDAFYSRSSYKIKDADLAAQFLEISRSLF